MKTFWKHKGRWREKCHECNGKGWVPHEHEGEGRIEHPLNDRGYPRSYLCRCACGMYLRRFYDEYDDSIDLPADEELGMKRPPNEWEPEGGWNE